MGYNVHFQTMPAYKGIKYGQGTVYTSGCGCAALCNALDALGIARVSVKAMCAYAVSVDARVKGGTDEGVLLKHAAFQSTHPMRGATARTNVGVL